MPVTFEDEKATSFGNVAESYDRVRPGPAPRALDWLVPDGCEVAVDLAAGTGLFTRELIGRAARVVAVEPDARMREVLARRSPEVDVREGWGEAMPLPDASADAVFVSTAWHWLDPARAVPEIARVLRPGGRLGVIWTSRNRDQDSERVEGVPVMKRTTCGSPQTEALLGWVVREGVTNVVRHSRASQATIELRTGGGHAHLTITDNGIGPAAADAPDPDLPTRTGTGLRGLTERLAAAGGSLASGLAQGGGFRVAAVLPVEEDASV